MPPPSPIAESRTIRELRSILECFAARHAARRVAQGVNVAPLERAWQRFEQIGGIDRWDLVAAADIAFHRAIVMLADVSALAESWEIVQRQEAALRRAALEVARPAHDLLLDIHRPLLTAIRAGSSDEADYAMKTHMELVWYRLVDDDGELTIQSDRMAVVRAYLELHLDKTIRLSFLAKHVGRTSAVNLARLFLREHGVCFTQYLMNLRLRRAAEMLATTTCSVRSIAGRVGYRDASRFGEHFRRAYGLPPRIYRQRNRHSLASV
jgi:AraC-like DNA-binding protein